MKRKYIILLSFRIIAALFLIAATWIATVSIPKIDKKINTEKELIDKFRDSRQLGGIPLLNSNHISTRKRIDLLEANLNQNRDRQIELRQKALERMVTVIQNWSAFFTGEDKQYFDKAESDIEKVVSDNMLTIENKIKETELILEDVRTQAMDRFMKAQEKFTTHNKNKGKFEQERLAKNIWFVWLQIMGLILLALTEILEKIIVINKNLTRQSS